MNRFLIILIVVLFQSCIKHCLNNFNGRVVSSETNEPIDQVRVILVAENEIYVELPDGNNLLTNDKGEFKIDIMTGTCWDNVKLLFVKDGYSPRLLENIKNNSETLNVYLEPLIGSND